MFKFSIEKQIKRLYGIMESIFHIVSMCFEIPSGVVADVFGRKKTLMLSLLVSLTSSLLMIFSRGFWSTVLAIGFCALGYNLSSGTREAIYLFYLDLYLEW